MQTQKKQGELEFISPRDAVGLSDSLVDRTEFERKKELLVATFTGDRCKDAITMCSFNMLETGKASAFAIYEHPDWNEVSIPEFTQEDYFCNFGEDTSCPWHELTKVDEFLKDGSAKKQALLCRQNEDSGETLPRDDVLAVIMTFPLGNLWRHGLNAKDIRRPTKAMLDFYLMQEQLHPGFICGVLTNDGMNSGLLVFKKSDKVKEINSHRLVSIIGKGDGVDKSYVLGAMGECGITFAEINLKCSNKVFEERVTTAITSIH